MVWYGMVWYVGYGMVWYGLDVCMYVCTYVRMNEYYESYVINTFLTHLKQFCLHMNTRVSH